MDLNYYKSMEPFFGSWKIKRLIGEGSFGKVFELEREDFGRTYKAALKAITIPQNESEIKSVLADGMDMQGATTYYKEFVGEVVDEFALMAQLKGNSHIVSYEDHVVVEHKEGIGWDILIRMELLTPLLEYTADKQMTQTDVVKLGIDICKALEYCGNFHIIHRDIKPENIFISPGGDYKLGDFGIARTVEKTTGWMSKKGTYTYMAPEVYKGEDYGASVDIYSLGIVLYRLINNNRVPFMPAYPAPITYSDRESSIARRVNGEKIPSPAVAGERLSEIILKACAYMPKDRYTSPEEMRKDLEELLAAHPEASFSANPSMVDTVVESTEMQREDDTVLLLQETEIDVQSGTMKKSSDNDIPEDATVSDFVISENLLHEETLQSSSDEDSTVSLFGSTVKKEEMVSEEESVQEQSSENTKNGHIQETLSDTGKSGKNKSLLIGIVVAGVVVIIAVALFFMFGGSSTVGGDDYSRNSVSDQMDEAVAAIENSVIKNPEEKYEEGMENNEVENSGTNGYDETLLADSSVGYFNELLFGRYSMVGEDGSGMQAFLSTMQFEEDFSQGTQLSILPVMLRGTSSSQEYSWEIIGYTENSSYMNTKENQSKIFAEMVSALLGYENTEMAEAFYMENISGKMDNIELTYVDSAGNEYSKNAYYSIEDERFIVYNATVDASGELSLESTVYDISRDNYTFQLSRNGLSVNYLPYGFENEEYSLRELEGYVSSSEDVYEGISYIKVSKDPDSRIDVYFADGKVANDPVANFSDENTVTIDWKSKSELNEDGNGTHVVDEGGSVTFRYIPNPDVGFILIGKDDVYKYQKNYPQYFYPAFDKLDEIMLADGKIGETEEGIVRQLLVLGDKIQTELFETFKEQGVDVKMEDGVISLDSSILFDIDSAELSEEGKIYLNGFTDVYDSYLSESDYLEYINYILVEGFTDSAGSDDYNLALSEKRAEAVVDYCEDRSIVMMLFLRSRGRGSTNLIYKENGEEDAAASRRVEFRIVLGV